MATFALFRAFHRVAGWKLIPRDPTVHVAQVHCKLPQILQLFVLQVLKRCSGNWHQLHVGTAVKKMKHWCKSFQGEGECCTSAVRFLLFYYPVKKLEAIWMIKEEYIRERCLKRAYRSWVRQKAIRSIFCINVSFDHLPVYGHEFRCVHFSCWNSLF